MSNLKSQNNEVYVFGAGLNKCMFNFDLSASPPLIEDFFQIAITANEQLGGPFDNEIKPLLDYIYKNWRLSKDDLLKVPFNLEDCFTAIETQYRQALLPGRFDSLIELFDLRFKLRTLMFKTLSQFNGCQFQSELRGLGQILFNDKPGIITFNYDDFVESVIEIASHARNGQDLSFVRNVYDNSPITDKEISYSSWNWNRPLAYGINFDLVMIHDSSLNVGYLRKYIEGDIFYKHPSNKPYSWSILKLHGSFNWFRYIPPDATPPSLPKAKVSLPKNMENHIIIGAGDWELSQYPTMNGHYIEPIIVTPDIYKTQRLNDPIFRNKLLPLWDQAEKYLSKCKKLVIIGYSFPKADDLVKNLFQTALSKNVLDKLILVNPDPIAVEKAKSVCEFNEALLFNDLKEYLRDYISHPPSSL